MAHLNLLRNCTLSCCFPRPECTDICCCLDDFDARGADELTLRRGDKVELVELDEGFGDGWYLGKHMANGTTGLFPGSEFSSVLRAMTGS